MTAQAVSMSRCRPGTVIDVCLITGNPLVNQVLRKSLRRSTKFRVVEQQNLFIEEQPLSGVAIVDISSVERSAGRIPLVGFARTILLGDPPLEDDICRFLSSGVNGFVRYCEVERKLRQAVEVVATGRLYVSRAILEHFVAYARSTRCAKAPSPLTPRQKQILQLLQEHYTNKEIGSQLEISENTVKFHLAKIYSKLGVSDRHTAVIHARLRLPQAAVPEAVNSFPHQARAALAREGFQSHDAVQCGGLESGSHEGAAKELLGMRAAR